MKKAFVDVSTLTRMTRMIMMTQLTTTTMRMMMITKATIATMDGAGYDVAAAADDCTDNV